MDPTRILEADHREVEELLDRIERAEGPERTPCIRELAGALRAHMDLEEEVLYPAIEPVVGDEPVQEGRTEHELARKALADVERLGPDEPGFGAALDALRAGIDHHVQEEEDEVFPEVRRDGAEALQDAAPAFMQRRAELGLATSPEALTAAASKEELLEAADRAGLEGTSSMNKGELAEALRSEQP